MSNFLKKEHGEKQAGDMCVDRIRITYQIGCRNFLYL